ncbi:MAG: PD-(D/E)XK nuclease family protein [Ruminiclostridium sp.]|nr:PD-(D/E)XK nuclease family protein [Ruminiclostridium sp.]
MLRIIYGESGTGKSELLYRRAAEAAASGRNVVLFVPDQFSFEAEKKLYKTVEHRYSRFCRVSMFSREAQRILRRYGTTKEYADDIAKRIVMRSVLEQLRNSLTHYGSLVGRRGFAEFALNIVSDLRTAGLSPAKLRELLEKDDTVSDALGRKMDDICLIYETYDNELMLRFDDRLDDIRRAAGLILENDIFDGCDVFLDEFDHFSGNQELFIKALIEKADSVTAALTCDDVGGSDKTFISARKTIMRLNGGLVPDAADLEKAPGLPKEPPELRVIEARDIWQECDWICAEIRGLMAEGVRCRDIAVITSVSDYDPVLDSAMKKYGIPAFADIPEPLITKSFVRFAIYALRALSFDTDDILRYIKSGYVRYETSDPETGSPVSVKLSDMDISKLERVARVYDLRADDWRRPFPSRESLGTEPEPDILHELKELEELESLRAAIADPLEKLGRAVSGQSGAKITESLCRFLTETMSIETTIRGKCVENGEFRQERFDEYDELWEDTVTVFESAYKALGDRVLPLEEYIEILTDAFTSTTMARPPKFLDSVTLGDTSRSRFGSKSHVFLCGFVNGQMPPPSRVPMAFSAAECDKLAEMGISVIPARDARNSEELFTLYRCTHIPRQRLYVSYPYQGSDGGMSEPSAEVRRLAARYGVPVEGADNFGAAHYCRSTRSAEQYLAHIYNSSDPAGAADRRRLRAVLAKSPGVPAEFEDMLRSSSGRDPERDRHIVKTPSAAALLTMPTYSPTAIEKLSDCKFAFFCKYGLGLREENIREMTGAMAGSVVHWCLEHLLKLPGFATMTYRDIEAEVVKTIADYEKKYFFGSFGGSDRFSLVLRQLAKYAARAALRLRDDMSFSRFRPVGFEKELSLELGGITVVGRCDRLDGMRGDDGRAYVRIVDYKHNSKLKLRLSEVHDGYNLQMLLYLFGICERPGLLGGDAAQYFGGTLPTVLEPSSVSYFKFSVLKYGDADEPDTSLPASGPDGAEYFRRDYFRDNAPEGLILKDSPEEAEIESRTADIDSRFPALAPPRTKREKETEHKVENHRKLYSGLVNSVQIDGGEYDELRGFCAELINTRISEAAHGMAGACPSSGDACKYCQYKMFCGSNRFIIEDAG